MAQDGTTAGGASYTIDNVTFPVGRTKLQSIFDAIRSTNIGNTTPDLVAGQFWIDNNTPSTTVWTMYFFDGSNSIQFCTIDTINNTVNFIDSTFDLINDTTPQLGGDLDTNGNDINFGDNDKAVFGAGSDLQIYHDGSNSYVRDAGTGNLRITSDSEVHLAKHNNEYMVRAYADGAVQLYYDGGTYLTPKLATTSTGIDVTGNITTSGTIESIAPERHSIRPSLNLDFANSKVLDPRITFTRASSGVYYDGYSSVKAEENLIKYSQEFDDSYWVKDKASISANQTTAPDGTTTADELIENTDTSNHRIYYIHSGLDTSKNFTQSVFVKANTRDEIFMRTGTGGSDSDGVKFDAGTQTITDVGVGADSSSITDVGNGWYRCSMTFSPTLANFVSYIALVDGSGNITYTGDGSSSLYIWGFQLEQRDSLTAYTATSGTAITKYQPALQTAGNNVARFDHNPTTGESLGLLIEEQRTNLQVYSEEFDNGAWNKVRTTITANTILAPDGTLTADKLFVTTDTGWHYMLDSNSVTSGNTYTISFYAKKAEQEYISAHFPSAQFGNTNTGNSCTFNLSTGVISNQGTYLLSASITDVGNGWYRCSLTKEATSTASADLIITLPNQSSFTTSGYTGDGYSGIYIWGAQFEQGSFPTSYIKTTGSQVTRSADITQITGDNFTSFFSSQVGTLLAHFGKINEGDPNIGERIIAIYPDNSIVKYNLEGYRAEVRHSSGWDGHNFNNETRAGGKVAMAFDETGFISASNGVSQGTTTRVPYTNKATKMYIGNTGTGGQPNACIQKIAYYPIRLTSNELIDLTEA